MKLKTLFAFTLIFTFGALPAFADVTADPKIKNSFVDIPVDNSGFVQDFLKDPNPATPVNAPHNKFYLGIKKSALEKEFLLTGSIIPQTIAATSSGLQGRIVSFRRYGDKVFMLEATQGHVVTNDLPSRLVLAEIPVIESMETDDLLVLDFNEGMKNLFLAGNWYATDFGASYSSMNQSVAAAVQHSYLESVKTKNNRLEIRQVAQLNLPMFNIKFAATYEARYYLAPYAPNPNYTPKRTSNFKHVGFFEVAPQLDTAHGGQKSFISIWDDKKPITFHVSANTPKEYVQAVKDGILYWNKAFGKEVVKAEMAPKGVTAPDPDYNIVQWVPWDYAGFAYADGLMDPRTGEILHAQVYLTSAFAFISKQRARMLLRQLKANKAKGDKPKKLEITEETLKNVLSGKTEKHPHVFLKFLHSARLCNYDQREQLANTLQTALANGADDKALQRLSSDWVRGVTAHEIGHTLGLRHNFAGNLHSNLTLKERDEAFVKYFMGGKDLDVKKYTTSSVMDYLTIADDAMSGGQFKDLKEAYAYDKLAVEWAYQDKKVDRKTGPLFCTDSGLGRYEDCMTGDSGADTMASNAWNTTQVLTLAAENLVEAFMRAKAPLDPHHAKPMDEVSVNPSVTALRAVIPLYNNLLQLKKGRRSLSIDRKYPVVNTLNEKEVLADRLKLVEKRVKGLGGVENAFFSLLPVGANWDKIKKNSKVAPVPRPLLKTSLKKLDTYLAREDVKNFVGMDGKTHSFTKEEIETIKKVGKKYFERMEEDLLQWTLLAWSLSKSELDVAVNGYVKDDSMSAKIEKKLAEAASKVVMAEGKETIEGRITMNGYKPVVHVKKFKHELTTRKLATKLVSGSIGVTSDWSKTGRTALKNKLKSKVANSLGAKYDAIKPSNLSRALRQWHSEQKSVVGSL